MLTTIERQIQHVKRTLNKNTENPEKTHNMDMIEEEVNFYEDNCHVGYIARRKPTVCKKSQENQNRMEKRSISLEKKIQTSEGTSEVRDQVEGV